MTDDLTPVDIRTSVRSDNPVTEPSEDALRRFPMARSFARQVLALDSSQGVVVGVLGRWGAGKTSFVNFARKEFESSDIVVLDFNPWMFSGAEQLVDSFFIELSAQLRDQSDERVSAVADVLANYGEAFEGLGWIPVAGAWIERSRVLAKILGSKLENRKEGIGARKQALEAALNELDRPIIVVLDDIDRLTTDEIRHIFKLVRLTASLPNIIYVLAFDRFRIEQALAEQGISGRDYLEKIIQVTVDLPSPPKEQINMQTLTSIDEVLSGIERTGPFDADAWQDIAAEVVLPLVRSMRDVRRYVASAHGTILSLDGQIALQDVLALEAIRVFIPDVFAEMTEAVPALTESGSSTGDPSNSASKAQLESLVELGDANSHIVKAALERLFPAAQRHIGGSIFGRSGGDFSLKSRRVANASILRLYFERSANDEVIAFSSAELLWAVLADMDALNESVEAIDLDEREDVIRMLETYEADFRPEHVVPAAVVLLNQWPKLPEKERGLFGSDARLTVGRVVYRLLRSLGDPNAVEAAALDALPMIETLGAQFELISDVGYREGAGHKLVSADAAKSLEKEWARRVSNSSVDQLLIEPDLLRTLYFANEILEASGSGVEVGADPKLTLQILRTGRTYTRRQSVDSRTIRRSLRLPWSTIETVLGNESDIRNRLDVLDRSSLSEEDLETLDLATKYLEGWRPPELGEDTDES